MKLHCFSSLIPTVIDDYVIHNIYISCNHIETIMLDANQNDSDNTYIL